MGRTRMLYIGNCLARKGLNPTTIDILSGKLAMDFDVIKVSDKSNIAFRIWDMWRAILVNRKKADVILIDTYSTAAFHFAWSSAFLARLFKIPYIPFIHGGDFPKRIKYSPKLVHRFLKFADKIITPSGYLKEKILHAANVRSLVIPNFLDLKQYPYKEHHSMESVKILWVRALAEIYNPMMAIDVLYLLHSFGFTDATLTMIGPDKDDLEKTLEDYASSKGLSNSTFIVGGLPKKDWVAMTPDFDCFINTTTIDNTPVSVMEAMALGLPVISTDVGGIPFIIDDGINGLLVEEGDVNGMAEAIRLLKNDAILYRTISQAARKKALDWDWEEVKFKWTDLLSKYSPGESNC